MKILNYLQNLFLYKKSAITKKDTYVKDNARSDLEADIVYCNNYKTYKGYEHFMSNIIIKFVFNTNGDEAKDTLNDMYSFINLCNKFDIKTIIKYNDNNDICILVSSNLAAYSELLYYCNFELDGFNIFISELNRLMKTLTPEGFSFIIDSGICTKENFSEEDNYEFNKSKDYYTTKKRIGSSDSIDIIEMDDLTNLIDDEFSISVRDLVDISYFYIITNIENIGWLCTGNNSLSDIDEDGYDLIRIRCRNIIEDIEFYKDSNNHSLDTMKNIIKNGKYIIDGLHIYHNRLIIFGNTFFMNYDDVYEYIDEIID